MWTPERLTELAEQCRILATKSETKEAKASLLRMAKRYQREAQRADA